MSLDRILHSSGSIDESLAYIVTTMRIYDSYLNQVPDWVQAEASGFRNPRPRIDRIFDEIKNGINPTRPLEITIRDEEPQFFIGNQNKGVIEASAPGLVHQLAELGIVPQSRKLVLKKRTHLGLVFDLKIFWSKSNPNHDSELHAEFIRETSSFFHEWHLKYGWSAKGIEFVTDIRFINLFFSERHKMLPSQRMHEIIVKTDEETGVKRFVAI